MSEQGFWEIDTPMLILHSEQDLRCPIEQSEELFIALRLLGRALVVLGHNEEAIVHMQHALELAEQQRDAAHQGHAQPEGAPAPVASGSELWSFDVEQHATRA